MSDWLVWGLCRLGEGVVMIGCLAIIDWQIDDDEEEEEEEEEEELPTYKSGAVLQFPVCALPPCWDFHEKGECKPPCTLKSHQENSITLLRNYINCAKETLDICVYMAYASDLKDAVIDAHKRGVKVRVISNVVQGKSCGTIIEACIKYGIPSVFRVPTKHSDVHHKFIIVDRKMLLHGSLNWTQGGIYDNREFVRATDKKEVIVQFEAEFTLMWGKFKAYDEEKTAKGQKQS